MLIEPRKCHDMRKVLPVLIDIRQSDLYEVLRNEVLYEQLYRRTLPWRSYHRF